MNNKDLLAERLDFTYKKEESPSDIRNLIAICLNYWYLFVISIICCLIIGFFYINRMPSQWSVVSKIIVEDDNNSPEKSLTSGMSSNLAAVFDMKNDADNEVKVLKSRTLLKRVVSAMDLNVHLIDNNGFRDVELYDKAPVAIEVLHKGELTKPQNYNIQITGNNTFNITGDEGKTDISELFGKPVKLGEYTISINKTLHFEPEGDYKIRLQPLKQAEKELGNNFNAALDDKQATVIDLQLSYDNPKRGEQVLQKLMQIYLQDNRANKIRIADSTMKFIDNRLVVVGAELDRAEKKLEQFKVRNKISDINAQSKALITGADEYQSKLNENEVQLAVVNDLYKYVNDGTNPQVVPSSLITKDVAFGTAINAYNEMLLRKEQLKLTLTENSVVIRNLDQQIEVARRALMTSLKNYRQSLQVSQSAFKRQNTTIENQITNAPVKERLYLDFARQQSLKQELYLFLLQKREETAISQTATLSSCRVLDEAESDDTPFAPKKSLIYLIALFAGLCLPATGLSIKEMLNIRIVTKADIEKHTNVPLLAEISRSTSKDKHLVYNDARSVISEEIRALRTSLKYITEKGRANVIMFTSSMSGEGKSFISLNLGNSIALSGKKVVMLELDLRKPKLLKNIGIDSDAGFTNYIIAPEGEDIDKYIKPSTFNENFYFISSGTIPPNPAELLMSDRVKTMIDELKEKFDYVIIDTAPVGLVSDALIVEEFADITFYVVRQNYTYKSQLGIVNDLHRTKKAKHLYLIVNDIEIKKNGITGYGHGYGNYGYEMENPSNKLMDLVKKLKPVSR
jgi:tyrosine-protein kinase Etk/Wzc